MSKITLNPSLRHMLSNLETETEFCDESGRTVGYYVPADRHREPLYAWAKAQVSEEELAGARKQSGGRPLAEILADLEKQ